MGLDIADAARDYIQLYRGDSNALTASLDRIQRTVASILKTIHVGDKTMPEAAWAVPRPLVLPYVQHANGTRTLASLSDVVVLPPTVAGRFRVALTDAAVRGGVTGVEFRRTIEAGLPATCAALNRQIQLNARSVRPQIPPDFLGIVAVAAIVVAFTVVR